MAKKKSRSANVARKREKRNRNSKSKQKKIAAEKQRKPAFGKMDDERLHALLMQTHDLINEPEIKELHFDLELMRDKMTELFVDILIKEKAKFDEQKKQNVISEPDDTIINEDSNIKQFETYFSEIHEKFCTEVFLSLVTPRFVRSLFSALSACENRLKQTGNRDRAEIVFVAQSLFEVVPPNVYVEHPIIQEIGIQTLRIVIENPLPPDLEKPFIKELFSSLLENKKTDNQDDQLSDMYTKNMEKNTESVVTKSDIVDNGNILVSDIEPPKRVLPKKPDLETLPAKAIYKNFDGLAIKDVLNGMNNNILDNVTPKQLDFYTYDQELCITVTENRVHLHAHSEEKLTTAMKNLESQCQSSIMYLAKTYEEGGKTDATE